MKTKVLQPFLGSDKNNPFFEILIDPDTPDELLFYFASQHLETVTANSFEEKLLIARLYNAKFSRRHLKETFGYDRKTMSSWGAALKSGSPERIQRIFFGQGPPPKLLEEHKKFIKQKYHELVDTFGCHVNAELRKLLEEKFDVTVSHETIRLLLLEEKTTPRSGFTENVETLEFPPVVYSEEARMAKYISSILNSTPAFLPVISDGAAETSVTAEHVDNLDASGSFQSYPGEALSLPKQCSKKENTWKNDSPPSVESSENSNYSPSSPRMASFGFPLTRPMDTSPFLCHHGGLALCRAMLDQLTSDMGDVCDVVRQWTAMVLCDCKNIENGQKLNYASLSFLVGDTLKSAFRQRERLHEVATEEAVMRLLGANMNFVKAGLDDTFLYDPHGVEYTGMLKILKGWLGSSHKIGKAYYQDFIHTTEGCPVFVDLDDNFYDMRERFVHNVAKFRRLLDGDRERWLTFVVDRAIYDIEHMRVLREEHHVYIITWEKGYEKGQWEEAAKTGKVETPHIVKRRNRHDDTIMYAARYVARKWAKDESFTQFVVILSKPGKDDIELSVIRADASRSGEDALRPILNRWVQEIGFMFMIKLGLNEITSYKDCAYDEVAGTLNDRLMENKKRKKLLSERMTLKKKLGLELLAIEEFEEERKIFEENGITLAQLEENIKRQCSTASRSWREISFTNYWRNFDRSMTILGMILSCCAN